MSLAHDLRQSCVSLCLSAPFLPCCMAPWCVQKKIGAARPFLLDLPLLFLAHRPTIEVGHEGRSRTICASLASVCASLLLSFLAAWRLGVCPKKLGSPRPFLLDLLLLFLAHRPTIEVGHEGCSRTIRASLASLCASLLLSFLAASRPGVYQ